jgi:hypothetical protein
MGIAELIKTLKAGAGVQHPSGWTVESMTIGWTVRANQDP